MKTKWFLSYISSIKFVTHSILISFIAWWALGGGSPENNVLIYLWHAITGVILITAEVVRKMKKFPFQYGYWPFFTAGLLIFEQYLMTILTGGK